MSISAVDTTAPLPGGHQLRPIDYPRVTLIGAGHLLNDMYSNLLTALMPYLVLSGRITATTAGLVLLVYLLGSSVLQPFFGVWVDRRGMRLFAVLGPIWVGIGASFAGWAPGAAVLFGLAAFSSIGSAAFHPQAASLVNALSSRSKGWTMSIFSMGGNLGFAVGPVLAAGIAIIGLHWSVIALVPGVLLTVLLLRFTPTPVPVGSNGETTNIRTLLRPAWRKLSLIVGVIATRSAVQYALIFFLPLYFHSRGQSAELGSLYAFVLSLAGAGGGLIGGHLSDVYGRRLLVVSTLLAVAPLLAFTLVQTGPILWPLLAVSGAVLLASNSVNVVQAQELLPANAGVASGITLGFAFGLSGVIASGLTTLSDHIGVAAVIHLVPVLPVIAGIMALGVADRTVPAV